MKIIVTGGCGFIGSNFLHWLYEKDLKENFISQIINLDFLSYAGNRFNQPAGWVKLKHLLFDISHIFGGEWFSNGTNIKSHTDLFSNTDLIVNFAAESHVDRSIKDCNPFLETNIIGTVNLLNRAKEHGVKRFVHISTDEVYGNVKKHMSPSTENDKLDPRNPYSASKAAAEHFVRAYHETYGLDTVITRGSNTYGPRQYPEKIIPLFIKKLMNDEQVPVYGNGSAIRDYMYVDDHCAGIWAAAMNGKSGCIYNLGSDNLYNGNQVAKKLIKLIGKDESYIKYVEDRLGHDYKYHMDSSKAANNLGWKAAVSFDEGLKRTLDWYLENSK